MELRNILDGPKHILQYRQASHVLEQKIDPWQLKTYTGDAYQRTQQALEKHTGKISKTRFRNQLKMCIMEKMAEKIAKTYGEKGLDNLLAPSHTWPPHVEVADVRSRTH